MPNKDTSLINLASDNKDLRNKIAVILIKLESDGIVELEDQVCTLMTNMMNFFSIHIEEIPSFDSLSKEQQEALLLKFKKVSHSLKSRKIKSIDEMMQTFIFTILSKIEERVESIEHLTAAEIMSKKTQYDFKTFLRKAASHEIYRISEEERSSETAKGRDFIHKGVFFIDRCSMQSAY